MGGAQGGEYACRMPIESWGECFAGSFKPPAEALAEAFRDANRRVIEAASVDASLEGMGTTLVAALENGLELLIASVGDSRAYCFEAGQLTIITEDQTWVEEVGRRLGIDEGSLK